MKIEDIQKDIKAKTRVGVANAIEEAYQVASAVKDMYYGEYPPVEYIRTNQLAESLQSSEVRQAGNSFEADVEYLTENIHYPSNPVGISGLTHSKDFDDDKIIHGELMEGIHGGAMDGTPIWPTTLELIEPMAYELIKDGLLKAGLPIK